MNFLSLPDLFLRKLMRSMKIIDRLRLRLTCRCISICLEEEKFGDVALTNVDEFHRVMNHLFNGISIAELDVEFIDDATSLLFIRNFIEKFEIGTLNFKAYSPQQLEHCLRLIAVFPSSTYSMKLYFHPNHERLLALPSLEYLETMPEKAVTSKLPTEIFLKLLATQTDLYFNYECVSLSSEDWLKAMEVVSAAGGTRIFNFFMKNSTIVNCLSDYGISESSKDDEQCGEFELLSIEGRSNDVTVHFRHLNCFTRILGVSWSGGEGLCDVTMETNEEWRE